jgi:peroxiredoxin
LGLPLLCACARLVPRSAGPPAKAKAPPFELTGHDGKRYALAKLIKDAPAVVVFYRGFW